MYELSQIILWILGTLRPAMAVEANLVDIIASGFAMFDDDEEFLWLSEDPRNSAMIAAAFADSHAQLDLLIYLRACEIAGVASRSRGFIPNRNAPGARHTPETCWRIFQRLVMRFEDRERLAHLRAARLKREAASPLRLPTSSASSTLRVDPAALRAEEETRLRSFIVQISSSSAQHWGRWIGASSRRDGGGSYPRGPPLNSRDCPLPIASQPPARTRSHATLIQP